MIDEYLVTWPAANREHVVPADGNMADDYVRISLIVGNVIYIIDAMRFK